MPKKKRKTISSLYSPHTASSCTISARATHLSNDLFFAFAALNNKQEFQYNDALRINLSTLVRASEKYGGNVHVLHVPHEGDSRHVSLSAFVFDTVPQDALVITIHTSESSNSMLSELRKNDNVIENSEMPVNPSIVDSESSPLYLHERNEQECFEQVRTVESASKVDMGIKAWCAKRFIASVILDLCHLGRGCPVGIDQKYHIEQIASNQKLMEELLCAVSAGVITSLPEICKKDDSIPAWKIKHLWDLRSRSYGNYALKRNESYRQSVIVIPLDDANEDLQSLLTFHAGVKNILTDTIVNYERGFDCEVEDIIYSDSDATSNIAEAFEELQVTNLISAIANGMPVEDLLFS